MATLIDRQQINYPTEHPQPPWSCTTTTARTSTSNVASQREDIPTRMTSTPSGKIDIGTLVNSKQSSNEPDDANAPFPQPHHTADTTQAPSHHGSQIDIYEGPGVTHHAAHMAQTNADPTPSDIHYATQKQIDMGLQQGPMYIQHPQERVPSQNNAVNGAHLANNNQQHPTSGAPSYGYSYYGQQYHGPALNTNIPPHQQQSMPSYTQPQPHPHYNQQQAPHLRYPQMQPNPIINYATAAYNMPDMDQHPPPSSYYHYQSQETRIAPHLRHNPIKIEPLEQADDKINTPQPYKKVAVITPKTPPSTNNNKRKRSQIKEESNSSRADGDENSVDHALTDEESDGGLSPAALSSDDSYEDQKRRKKRRKPNSNQTKTKEQNSGSEQPEKFHLPDPDLIEQTKVVLKEYGISQKVLAHQLPASETMVSLWMNRSKKLIGWQELESKVKDWLQRDHRKPEKQTIVNFIDETTRVKQRLDGGFK